MRNGEEVEHGLEARGNVGHECLNAHERGSASRPLSDQPRLEAVPNHAEVM